MHSSTSRLGSLVIAIFGWVVTTGLVHAQDLQKPSDIDSVRIAVKRAEDLFKEKNFEQSAKYIDICNTNFVDLVLAGERKDIAEWERIHRKLSKAAEVLAIEGAELSPLPAWGEITAKLKEMKEGSKKPADKDMPKDPKAKTEGVSFSKDVAPVLVQHCGRCHVDKTTGGFTMPTYEGLMKGSRAGVVLFAGDPEGSPLVEAMASGTMPPSGAKFDGEDPKANLRVLVGGPDAKPPEPPKPVEVMERTGKETVSFANDIAPILVANCNGCHYGGNRPSGGLNFTNFAGLLRGGMTGAAIEPKKGKESLLVKKLLGEAGQRMPAGGRPALKPEDIEKITKWIDEGATYDGGERDSQLESVIAKSWAAKASHSELMDKRMSRARERWKIVSPTVVAEEKSNDEFHVLGNAGPAVLEQVMAAAETAAKSVRKQYRLSPKDPIVRGGITIYALKSRYDYSELGKMLEKRSLPQEWSSHWKRDVLDMYIAIVPDKSNAKLNESALVQQITSVWMASHEGVPKWFADGAGRAALAQAVGPNDERVKPWIQKVPLVVDEIKDVKPLMEGKLNDEDEAIVGFALVRNMQSSGMKKQYDSVTKALSSGSSFDEAFSKTIGPIDKFLSLALGKTKK
jgi:mono/diheme cytochrome c family protein